MADAVVHGGVAAPAPYMQKTGWRLLRTVDFEHLHLTTSSNVTALQIVAAKL